MMIRLKSPEEVEKLRNAADLVGRVLGEVGNLIEPGVTTLKLDKLAEELIRDFGGEPAFKGYKPSWSKTPYAYTLCTSINDEVVHGMPTDRYELKEGSLVTIDCGVKLDGFFGDSAFTFPVGEVSPEWFDLLLTTYQSLELGLEQVVDGNRLGDLGFAVQNHVESKGYSVVKDMVGHGIGTSIHEPPEVPNYGKPGKGQKLKTGMVLCVEPMVNLGGHRIFTDRDGWTIKTDDGSPSVHFEKMVAVGDGKPDVLTPYSYIALNKVFYGQTV